MLKSVLKCIESIRIKKWVKKFQISRANLGGGRGLAELVKAIFFTLPLIFYCEMHQLSMTMSGTAAAKAPKTKKATKPK